MATTASELTDRHYGAKVTAVEPGGAEAIPLVERHGKPIQLLWTWTSPNMEFATVFVGIICVLFFGLTFWQAVLAIAIGTGLGAISHGVLSSWGPKTGQCQMVLSRRGFGFLGNFLPAGLNSLTAGIGWFAVNSVSGGLALAALTDLNKYLSLVIVAMAIVMGTAGFIVAAVGIDNIATYENFLLVIAYWIGPWLGVVFADRVLRRYRPRENVTVNPKYRNWPGFIAMIAGAAVSIWLFSDQTAYVGMVPSAIPEIGDVTFEVGFVLAFVSYAVLFKPFAGPITFAPSDSVGKSPGAGL